MNAIGKFLSWFFTAFMALCAVSFFPSASSLFFVLAAIVSAPVSGVRDFLAEKGVRGFVKVGALAALFVVSVVTAPIDKTPEGADVPEIQEPPAIVEELPAEDREENSEPEVEQDSELTPDSPVEPDVPAAVVPVVPPVDAEPEVVTPPVVAEPVEDEKDDYVLNTNTMKFHVPSCGSVEDIKPGNRSDVTASRDDIIAQGYKPCGRCHP